MTDAEILRSARAVIARLRADQQDHVDGLIAQLEAAGRDADEIAFHASVEGVHPVARLVALDNLQQDLSALIADLDHFTDAG